MNTPHPRIALTHEEVFELLPFHANGSLRGDELAAMQAHLGSCLICRRELAIEHRTMQAFEGNLVEQSAQAAFQRLMQDVRGNTPAAPRRTARAIWRDRFEAWLGALTARPVLAAVPLLVAVAAGLLVHHFVQAPERAYRVLASRSTPPAPGSDTLRVIFTPGSDPAAIPLLLARLELSVVDGPNAGGAYTVRIAPGTGDVPGVLARLRAQPAIALAEPASPLAVERPQ